MRDDILQGFPGPPGPARPHECTPKNQARLLSGTQFNGYSPFATLAKHSDERGYRLGPPDARRIPRKSPRTSSRAPNPINL
jgi:hypothetical protein